MTKTKFLLKEALFGNSTLIILGLALCGVQYFFDGTLGMADFPWLFVALILFDIIGLFYNLSRLKKMGIDVGLAKNQNGTITKSLDLDLPQEKVLNLLKQNVWKFKTESKTETEGGVLLVMKYYRLLWNEKIEILIEKKGEAESKVRITAGVKKKHFLWSAHNSWGNAIRHIKYFEQELQKRETLHQEVGTI